MRLRIAEGTAAIRSNSLGDNEYLLKIPTANND